jgi:hypothetical protein
VPVDEYTEGEAWWDAAHGVWFPQAVAVQVDAKALNLPEGDDALSGTGFTFQFRAFLADTTMPASCRTVGMGPIWKLGAGLLGIDFVLEAGYDDAAVALIGGTKTFTRASTAWAFDAADGKLKPYATDTIRREVKGWLLEPQRTQKCTRNHLHGGAITGWTKTGDAASTLTAVADATELAAAGLDQICSDSYVLKLDNSAGITAAKATNAGTAGNTNQHACSAFMRGSGDARPRLSGAGIAGSFVTLTSSYVLLQAVLTPDGAGNVLQIEANAGAVVYFVLGQLEEGAYAASPIPNAGDGQITRVSEALSFAFTQAVDTVNGVSVQVEFSPLYAEGASLDNEFVFSLGNSLDPRIVFREGTGGVWEVLFDNGAAAYTQSLVGDSFDAGAAEEATVVYDPALAKKWRVDDGDTDVTPAASYTGTLPSSQWGGSMLYVGHSLSGGNSIGGHIRRLVVVRGNHAAAKLRALKRSA